MAYVPVSKKHGVNPTMPICFWCGEETGEIALLGKIKGDKEAPRNLILNRDPCPECVKLRSQGITIMAVTSESDHTATSQWVVIQEEAIEKMINDPQKQKEVLKSRGMYISTELFNKLFKS